MAGKLGKPAGLDDLVSMPKDMLIDELNGFTLEGEDPVKLTPVQVGRLVKCYDKIVAGAAVVAVDASPPAKDTKPTIPETSVKLAHIVNETLDGYVTRPKTTRSTSSSWFTKRLAGAPLATK